MERNYIKEMVCLEAYTTLKDGARGALSMLHEGKIKEAEEQLRCCLLHGEIIMDKNCEEYFCINQK